MKSDENTITKIDDYNFLLSFKHEKNSSNERYLETKNAFDLIQCPDCKKSMPKTITHCLLDLKTGVMVNKCVRCNLIITLKTQSIKVK